jgi:4-hydroxybenzoate-CoA ligase
MLKYVAGGNEVNETNSNAALYFVDRHAGGQAADQIAFVEGDRTLSYRELARESGRLAGLYAAHGLQPEDRAAMIVLDTIEFPIIFWGSLKAGIVPAPLNTLLTTENYEAILNDSRAKALFVSEELLSAVEPVMARCRSLKAVLVIGGEGEHRYLSFAEELAKHAPVPAVETSPDQCAFWLYSSGSTGRPKGVKHVHSNLKATADTYGAQVLGIREDDVVFSAAKLFFAYGLGNAMTFPMSVGASATLCRARPTPDKVLDVMAETRPTIFCGVPTLYASLVAAIGDRRPAGFERLRRCVSAGEALPAEIGRRWRELTGVDILDGVGSTEMLHIFLSNAPGDVAYGTSGVAVPGYELRLVDEAGKEVADGEIGELLVKGASASDGYWNQRDKSRSTFEGHWTRTGDKYERRADGRYVYCGRTDDMFKVSGLWVSPFEVEQAIVSHPAVLEAAVVPAVDENGLEKPKAYVVLKQNVDHAQLSAALKEHVQEKIGKWKYPRWIEIVDELPKTATGKIQRFKLREKAGATG